MDVVLEGFDTFIFDRVYSTVLPSTHYLAYKTLLNGAMNATMANLQAESTAYSNYNFEPASKYFSFQPSIWAYRSSLPRDDLVRQSLSLFLITCIFGAVVYFVFATLSYVFVFDKDTFKHPKYLKNQISMEIKQSCGAFPGMALLTVPFFLAEVRGYTKMYDRTEEGPGLWYNFAQFPLFLMFTDFFIYWIHRGLHHPSVYKQLHKPHHKWIMPTPYASHAFHPMDGFAQSIPYHVFPFIFPLQKFAYVCLFIFINIWTVMIHDGEYVADSPVINGAACHTMHHLYFNYNYGQFTTISDRIFGSYRKPNDELFRRESKMSKEEWSKQSKEMEVIVKEVEGEDDRTYLPEETKKLQ
ncbi:C-5 sterol desaturase [Tothia fuscella]|uniref:C-5 sterol desaturase n=1 Tax=Tothia fuscella TaxID=1048955 RepID=A0A9P4TT09_9PEZI|nr:C-5 sterol desaturase [Tothia fuscella]